MTVMPRQVSPLGDVLSAFGDDYTRESGMRKWVHEKISCTGRTFVS